MILPIAPIRTSVVTRSQSVVYVSLSLPHAFSGLAVVGYLILDPGWISPDENGKELKQCGPLHFIVTEGCSFPWSKSQS